MTTPADRYHFGGHATFPVRYGWLSKGLERLMHDGDFSATTETADRLGLGSKMVESLAFWLKACGLAGDGQRGQGAVSVMARVVHDHDPHFELPATWWFLHIALARRPGTVWSWFFNEYPDRMFDRQACVDAFHRHAGSGGRRPPSGPTAAKDVSCLLAAYAARPGVDHVDPDDVGACPFRDLGLVLRHGATGRFERARAPLAIPPEAFLASASLLARQLGKESVPLRELAAHPYGPGRVLCMGIEAVEAMAGRVEAAGKGWARIEILAGEAHLRVPAVDLPVWMVGMYRRIKELRA